MATSAIPLPPGYKLSIEESRTQQRCVRCAEPFSPNNVYSAAGQRETQISGLCEVCFDYITKDIA